MRNKGVREAVLFLFSPPRSRRFFVPDEFFSGARSSIRNGLSIPMRQRARERAEAGNYI